MHSAQCVDAQEVTPVKKTAKKKARKRVKTVNKVVAKIQMDRQIKLDILAACERAGAPLTPQALNHWSYLQHGVPVARVRTVAKVLGMSKHAIRPDIFPRGT